jgi:hypothetical protein
MLSSSSECDVAQGNAASKGTFSNDFESILQSKSSADALDGAALRNREKVLEAIQGTRGIPEMGRWIAPSGDSVRNSVDCVPIDLQKY